MYWSYRKFQRNVKPTEIAPCSLVGLKDIFADYQDPSAATVRQRLLEKLPDEERSAAAGALKPLDDLVRPRKSGGQRYFKLPWVACPESILPRAPQGRESIADAYYSSCPRARKVYENWSVREFRKVIPPWYVTWLAADELLSHLQRDVWITPQALRRVGTQVETLPPFPPIRPRNGWQAWFCVNCQGYGHDWTDCPKPDRENWAAFFGSDDQSQG